MLLLYEARLSMFPFLRRPLPILALLLLLPIGLLASDQPPKLRLAEVEHIQPVSYRADLTIDPAADSFTGSILIRLQIDQPLQTIWLNQERISIQQATLRADGRSTSLTPVAGGDNFVGLHLDSPAQPGAVELEIRYKGAILTGNSAAVFRQEDNGNKYVFTQFEATDARGAFPCFDEPSYKTPWQLTLHVPSANTAISNTLPDSDTVQNGQRTVVFRQTKPLPSYLVAFAIGPFEYVPAGFTETNHAPIRIVVPKGHAQEAKYAAQVTAGIIAHHEHYFGIPYPFDKADQVAIPNTLGFGAMENPGMITYEQNALLAKPSEDTVARQRTYFTYAAHELAHQWFGDDVTAAWWNDIWLNEAFATWMEQKTTREMHSEWETVVDDVDSMLGAMNQDSLATARKIRQPIESTADINSAFDAITYQKGAALIGMFENWMTPPVFRDGVRFYLHQYAWKAATAQDFLGALSDSSHKDIAKPFSTFLDQSGIPVITVDLNCAGGEPILHLEQQRYVALGSHASKEQTWGVPVCVSTEKGQSACTLLATRTSDWKLKQSGCPAWVDANANAKGYYISSYSSALLFKLTSGDLQSRLNAPERINLMGDAGLLSSSGQLPAGDALKLATVLHDDPQGDVVSNALSLALSFRRNSVKEDLVAQYEHFLQANFDPRARKLGWAPQPHESQSVTLLRSQLVPDMATYGGDQDLAKTGEELAHKWIDTNAGVNPNMVLPALRTAAYYGDVNLFQAYLRKFTQTHDDQDRKLLVRGMEAFRNPAAIRAGMDAVLSGQISFIEGGWLLFSGQQSPATEMLPLDFLQQHWDAILAKMPKSGFSFAAVLPYAGRGFCSASARNKYVDFFQTRLQQIPEAKRTYENVLESIDSCIARRRVTDPQVRAFLQNYQPTPDVNRN